MVRFLNEILVLVTCPILIICVSILTGCQGKGNSISPVSRRIGFGAWQASCSGLGSFNRPEMKSQNGFPVRSPWVKSNSPGPSVVPTKYFYCSIMSCVNKNINIKSRYLVMIFLSRSTLGSLIKIYQLRKRLFLSYWYWFFNHLECQAIQKYGVNSEPWFKNKSFSILYR